MKVVLLLAAVFLASDASAQFGPWPKPPTIVVLGAEGDPRIPLVDEAIAYWNRVLEDIGSRFRLPAAKRVDLPIPERELREMSAAILSGRRPVPVPEALRGLPGDVTIALAQSAFVSFAGPFDADGKRVVGIRSSDSWPLTMPNVARNVIAHELGHVIGLRHNADATTLMCGRPAPCRPPDFTSSRPHIFPLTDDERRLLLRFYPPDAKQ